MKSYKIAARQNNSTTNKSSNKQQTKRRVWRIFAFAAFFVATALRGMFFKGGEHSYFEFLTSLLNDVVAPHEGALNGSNSSSVVSSSSTRYKSAENAELIIFYNLYIPQDDAGITNAINVIKDQMGQIASVLQRIENEHNEQEKKGAVFYNLIGNENAFTTQQMDELCHSLHPRLECNLLQFHDVASEAVTLQDVHDFCHSDIASNAGNGTRVVYLHSKGSYHSQKENHIWRKQMTDAALHPKCLNPPNDQCDVCGAQFYIKYAIMYPGNMWTAKCSYIRKLIPPNNGEYEKRKAESIKHFLMLRLWGVMQASLDTDNVEHFGLDRYQWEHWIAHPSIQPCELHTTDVGPLILLGKDQQGRKFGPQYEDWGMGPRRIQANLGGLRGPRLKLEASEDLSFREYYYLPGNLLKWFHLYGKDGVPAQDSWVWQHFPAGQRWKELVGQYGENAIDEMVKGSTHRYHSPFVSNYSTQQFDDKGLSESNPPIVVFYQISFPPENNVHALSAVKAQFDALSMGQYENTTNTFNQQKKISLYYTVAGGSSDELGVVSSLCKSNSDRITCRELHRSDSYQTQGEILQHIHTFCTANPTTNIVHIANRLPGYPSKAMGKTFNAQKVQTMTSAVTSKMCQVSGDTCNVCGKEFYPLPFLHFTGNMFSASCNYIKELLPPSTFEEQMNDIAGDALIAQIEERYTTKLLRFNARVLGSYQHTVEHWIGSHPDLKPCDVAPMNADEQLDGETILNQMKHYSKAATPRRNSAPPGTLDDEGEPKFRKRREVALREYYYLAGNVLKWHRLYGKVPATNSWAWHWFPDGQIWQSAAAHRGADAVDEIANELTPEES